MNLNQCLLKAQMNQAHHFRLVWSGVAYDIRINNDSLFPLLDWDITVRRQSPMGTMTDNAIRDLCLLTVLENSPGWYVVNC